MPIRDYRCDSCGALFENLEIDLTDGKIVCPQCGSKIVTRLISPFAGSKPAGDACDTPTPRTYG